VDLEEDGNELKISVKKDFDVRKKLIDVKYLERIGKGYLTSSYRQGYGEIDFHYSNPEYIKTIQKILSKDVIGFEIVKQEPNRCLIKDLTGHNAEEFENSLKRIWSLLLDLSKESEIAVEKKDLNRLENIPLMDYSINKFSNYCLRILAGKNSVNFKRSFLYYYLIKNLEEIADKYKGLCAHYLANPEKISNQTMKNFAKTNEYLEELYKLFYNYNEEKMENLFKKIKESQKKIIDLKSPLSFYLSSIVLDIYNLSSVLVELNLG